MDWFQSVVLDYLRCDRAVFVNPECLIRLDQKGPVLKGRHWYCDAVAAHFRERTLYLCEITYASQPQALIRRLISWRTAWPVVCQAVIRDSGIPGDWTVCPWVFLPEAKLPQVREKFPASMDSGGTGCAMPTPRFTALEEVLPWKDERPERKVAW